MKLRVLTYNIHKGFPLVRKRLVLSEIREAIESTKADIVCLQEVVGENVQLEKKIKDWPAETQFEYLADRMWKHYAYGKNAVYPKGHHGNAILSQYPIQAFHNTELTIQSLQQRGILHAMIEVVPLHKKLDIFCTHLDLLGKTRTQQLDRVIDLIRNQVQ